MSILNPENPMFTMARQGRRIPHLVVSILALLLLVIIAFGVTSAVLEIVGDSGSGSDGEEPVDISFLIFPFLSLLLLLWLWLRVYEKRGFHTLGFPRSNWLKKYCIGLALGFGMVAVSVGLMYLGGSIRLENSTATPTGVSALGGAALFLIGFMIQGGTEEVVFRGWMLQTMGARHHPLVGAIVPSVLFVAAHGSLNAIVIVNLSLFSIFLIVFCLREGAIWGVCGWHAAWNWAQAEFFGLEVSGHTSEAGSIFDLKAVGNSLISGGEYGPEGSLMATPVLVAGILFMLYARKRPGAGQVNEESHNPTV